MKVIFVGDDNYFHGVKVVGGSRDAGFHARVAVAADDFNALRALEAEADAAHDGYPLRGVAVEDVVTLVEEVIDLGVEAEGAVEVVGGAEVEFVDVIHLHIVFPVCLHIPSRLQMVGRTDGELFDGAEGQVRVEDEIGFAPDMVEFGSAADCVPSFIVIAGPVVIHSLHADFKPLLVFILQIGTDVEKFGVDIAFSAQDGEGAVVVRPSRRREEQIVVGYLISRENIEPEPACRAAPDADNAVQPVPRRLQLAGGVDVAADIRYLVHTVRI